MKQEVQSNNTSRMRLTDNSHTSRRSGFYHAHTVYKQIWHGSCFVNLIYNLRHIFHSFIFVIVSLNFGETWPLGGHAWLHCGGRCCCYVAIIVWTRTAFKRALSLNAYWDYKQWMNALWMFISNTESPWGPRAIDNDDQHHFKQWGICDN